MRTAMSENADNILECTQLGATILRRFASARERAWLISPYVTSDAVVSAARNCRAPSKRVVTRFDGGDIVAGATDLRVVAALKAAGIDVRVVQGIHAKVYVLDDWAYVGSANLTTRGLETSLREFGKASEHAEEVSNAAYYFEKLWADATELPMQGLETALKRLELRRVMLEKPSALQRHAAREVVEGLIFPRARVEPAQRRPLEVSDGARHAPPLNTAPAEDVVEFEDVEFGSDHNRFMNWRRDNEEGFYLTVKSRRHANLHQSRCTHQGNYDFGEYAGSATQDRKICSRDHRALYIWARERGIEIHRCITCNPPEL
jgi:hypothetical protein